MKQVLTNIMHPLKDEFCFSIFESYAFVNGKSDNFPILKSIGWKIVKKLKGLPLAAAKTVGRALFGNTDVNRWKDILPDELWVLKEEDDDVMPAL